MTVEEALKEYQQALPLQIAPAFAAATDILDLMKTKGAQVFVPRNWEGIRGIPPLVLAWRPDMPESMKPRARPVNPRLYQTAQKEFNRLSEYFYEKSTSPIASCIVIAPKAIAPFIRFCGDYVPINKYIHTGHFPVPDFKRQLEKAQKAQFYLDVD